MRDSPGEVPGYVGSQSFLSLAFGWNTSKPVSIVRLYANIRSPSSDAKPHTVTVPPLYETVVPLCHHPGMDAHGSRTGHVVRTGSGRSVRPPVDPAQFRSPGYCIDEMIGLQGCDVGMNIADE